MLSAVGVYDVQAVYTETRPTIALALQAAGNGAAADERRIEQVLMHFAVVPGPPQNVKIKPIKGSSHGAASCNNTRNLIALHPADFFFRDVGGNACGSAGVKPDNLSMRIRVDYEPLSGNFPLSGSSGSALAAAAVAAASASAAATAKAASSQLEGGEIKEVTVVTPPRVTLPANVSFNEQGKARLGEVRIEQNHPQQKDWDDCMMVFTLEYVGADPSIPLPPLTMEIRVPFVNTLKQDAKKREETERLAALKDQKQQLQNEHNKQLEERSQAEHQRQKAQQQMMRKHHEAFEEAKNFIVALHGPNNLPQALDIPGLRNLPSQLRKDCNNQGFAALTGLSNREQSALSDLRDVYGVVSNVFELSITRAQGWSPSQCVTVSAVLSDWFGPAAMTMVLSKSIQTSQEVLKRLPNSLRVLSTDQVTARNSFPPPLKPSDVNIPLATYASGLLQVRSDLAERIGSKEAKDLAAIVFSSIGATNVLIVNSEQDALAYQRTFKEWKQKNKLPQNAHCPALLALDGFTIASGGWMGGKNARKRTDTRGLPAHFGWADPTFTSDRLQQFEQRVSSLADLEQQKLQADRKIEMLDADLQKRNERALTLFKEPLVNRLPPQPQQSPAQITSEYSLRHGHSRTAEQAGLSQPDGAKRTRGGGSGSNPSWRG